MLFFLVTISNALQLELGTEQSLQANDTLMTFDKYEGSKHPVKPVALEQALQNVKKLPNEIRAMLTTPNATLPKVSEKERARALKAKDDKDAENHAYLTAHTTHGSHLVVEAHSGLDPNADAADAPEYKTLDNVRKVLNELYQETMVELDLEREDCYDAEKSLKIQIHSNTGSRVIAAATIAEAREEMSTAQALISQLKTDIQRANEELRIHNYDCKVLLESAEKKKAIIESDLHVASTIVNMTDCDAMEKRAAEIKASASASNAFFQCMVHSNGRSHVHLSGAGGKLMKEFKSQAAMQAMQAAARAAFGVSGDDGPDGAGDPEDGEPAGNMSQSEYDAAMDLPQDGAWMDNIGVAELPKDCKALGNNINIGEKCPILADAVGQMEGEIEDALFTQNQFINKEEDRCKETRDNLNDQIASDSFTLGQQQTELAKATKKLNENENELRERVAEFKLLQGDLIDRMTKCNGDLRQLFEEMCGLITIRNELYKMSGVHPYIQDCAVGDWSADECTVTCGGGFQAFTREITQESYFGAPCPPLSKEGMCNSEPCPIDCVYSSDWSQWSECSADCGGGVMARSRGIDVRDQYGGVKCEATQDDQVCNSDACNVDCKLGEWTEWSGCSKMCDGGMRTARKLEVEAAKGIGLCSDKDERDPAAENGGARMKAEFCNTQSCITNIACATKLDISFVLDGSGSVGWWGWQGTKRFARDSIKRLYLNYDDGAIASVVLFSEDVYVVESMTDNRQTLLDRVDGMHFPARWTMTGEGVGAALNLIKTGGRAGVPGIVFVVTDGKPTVQQPMIAAAQQAKDDGIRLHMVGVGGNMGPDVWADMHKWAAAPSEMNVIHVSDYGAFTDVIGQMISNLCPVVECRETFELDDESDYIGCQSETVSGLACQKWTDQTPHRHWFSPHWRLWSGEPYWPTLGDFAYCRNPHFGHPWHDWKLGYNGPGEWDYRWSHPNYYPGEGGGIWCHTTDPDVRWQYCDPRNVSTLPGQMY